MASWIAEKKDLGSFDSRIDPPGESEHFTLSLILRIFLRQGNPPKGKATGFATDADGRKIPTRQWTHAAWIQFRTDFRLQAYTTWWQAFLLTPPASYDGFVWPAMRGTRRKVLTTIDLRVVDHEDDTHARINVVRLAAQANAASFRSDDFDLDSGDVVPSEARGFDRTWQRSTVAHEVGHLLGLGHVNQRSLACREKPGTSVCYGVTFEQRMNVMGGGSALDLTDAQPWVERIAKIHTRTEMDAWTVDWASALAAIRGYDDAVEDAKSP